MFVCLVLLSLLWVVLILIWLFLGVAVGWWCSCRHWWFTVFCCFLCNCFLDLFYWMRLLIFLCLLLLLIWILILGCFWSGDTCLYFSWLLMIVCLYILFVYCLELFVIYFCLLVVWLFMCSLLWCLLCFACLLGVVLLFCGVSLIWRCFCVGSLTLICCFFNDCWFLMFIITVFMWMCLLVG